MSAIGTSFIKPAVPVVFVIAAMLSSNYSRGYLLKPSEKIRKLVSAHIPGAVIKDAESMIGGVSADAMLIDIQLPGDGTRKLVLREHGENHFGHEAELEFRLLECLYSLGVKVPKPLGFNSNEGTGQHPYVLLEYIDGTTDMPSSALESCITAAADKLISIHDLPTDSLPELPQRFDPLPELLDFLPDEAEWDELRSSLSRMNSTAFTGKSVLLHGDYWPSNIIWEDGTIVGVIDWEDSAIGDPLSDVACACLELRYIHGNSGAQLFLDVYSVRCEVDPLRFALWQANVAAAGNRNMGEWGLEPSRVQAMRKVALESIREAGRVIVAH
ncbi:phosphotransferase [Parasphingorhabdus sp.]|uniref:phosphotransferase family protein n=1 Tax=Parasphingorhabdus sp. TaxID=2709688 RepID=UPI0032673599